MPTNILQELEYSLRLPQAKLQQAQLLPEGIKLHLLALEHAELQLSPQQVAHFWQQLPYWAFAWAGGRALATFLNENPQHVKDKRVLDFGCGSGIVAIAAAKAGAQEVWVADLDKNALAAVQLNAQANNVHIKTVEDNIWPEVDILLASDVLYDISSSEDLKNLMLTIPEWLLAERRFVKPNFVQLQCMQEYITSTLPAIDDFDQNLSIEIYSRANQAPL
ncbi:MAG TPA: 50S ribosomal protein L11 methyltransferase [Pseudomonadales bacterium]|nr:50S ribosomal protein L11 methyltransferase [Pseudomonadales bacterium]